jgi:TIR domain/Outer membrane lipoprotein
VAGKILINYRRGDEPRFTSALHARLEAEFGRDNVLMDWEAYLDGGDSFPREVAAHVARGGMLLAVIGPRWVERLAMRHGDPEDFVRIEIEAALASGKPAIPILVGGAGLPHAEQLPETIHGLVRRGAVSLRPDSFEADCDELVKALKRVFSGGGRPAGAAQPAQASQRPQERAPEPAAAPENNGKPGEFSNWVIIRNSGDPDKFRSHLARYSGGPTERDARWQLEAAVWNGPSTRGSIEGLRRYLREFPNGEHADAAEAEIAHLQGAREVPRPGGGGERKLSESEAWEKASDSGKLRDLENFLADWPDSEYADDAKRMLREVQGEGKGGPAALLIMLGIVVLVLVLIVLAGVKF